MMSFPSKTPFARSLSPFLSLMMFNKNRTRVPRLFNKEVFNECRTKVHDLFNVGGIKVLDGKLYLPSMRKRVKLDTPLSRAFYSELMSKGLTLKELAEKIGVAERSILMRVYQEGLKHKNIKEIETTRKIIEGLSREGFREAARLLRELSEEWERLYEENRRASYERQKERVKQWRRRRGKG